MLDLTPDLYTLLDAQEFDIESYNENADIQSHPQEVKDTVVQMVVAFPHKYKKKHIVETLYNIFKDEDIITSLIAIKEIRCFNDKQIEIFIDVLNDCVPDNNPRPLIEKLVDYLHMLPKEPCPSAVHIH